MESFRLAAIRTAINIENRSLAFYYAVSGKVHDINTVMVFERIAKDGAEHLEQFCSLYDGDVENLVNNLNENNLYSNPFYRLLLNSIEGNASEYDALHIALEEKRACIEWYSVFLDTIREPSAHEVFTRIIAHSRLQHKMINDEYMRIKNTAGLADQSHFDRYERRNSYQTVSGEHFPGAEAR
jgi:rubrerythrin